MKSLTHAEIRRRIAAIKATPESVSEALLSRGDSEADARAALESRRGETFTDDEWSEAKRNLLNFFTLLAELNERYGVRS